MRAGQMNNRVEVQTSRDGTDPNGQPVKIWKTAFERWASIDPVGGTEATRGFHQIAADVTHVVKLHHDRQTAAISPIDRIKWGNRVLNITRVSEIQRRDVVLQVIERAAGMGAV